MRVDISQKLASSGICKDKENVFNPNTLIYLSSNKFTFSVKFPRYPKYNRTPSNIDTTINTATVINLYTSVK